MKIWLDLRLLKAGDTYSIFVATLLQKLISLDTEHSYHLYVSAETKAVFPETVQVDFIQYAGWGVKEHLSFGRKLQKDKNDLMIFFGEEKPLRYKWNYFLFVKDLKEVHYQSEETWLSKMMHNFFLNTGIENAQKIICFESQTQHDINEKLNIIEQKINILYPFFTPINVTSEQSLWNIKMKYGIKWEFFVYSSGNGNHKNLSKLIAVFKKLSLRKRNISLVVLDQDVSEDIEIRKQVIDSEITDSIFFIGDTGDTEKQSFYQEACGTLFPSLYESFPFSLTEAISYNSPILASSITPIKEIMGNSIAYFSPVSIIDMVEAIENFVSMRRREWNYEALFQKYNPENSAQKLLTIIKE